MSHHPKSTAISSADRWLEMHRRNPRAECRLFCLPYAGGATAIFRTWQKSLPEYIEVLPLQLPGRGRRMKEPPLRNIVQIAAQLAGDMLPVFREKPFAFFGHSMGATISYEVARKLREENGPRPLALFVSGRQAPHLPDRDKQNYHLPHDEFVHEVRRMGGTPQEILDCEELMELMIPVLRADFEAIQTYAYRPGDPLESPFFAFGGTEDPYIPETDIRAWGEHTSGEFKMKMFDGDHFFLHPKEGELLKDLAGEMARYRKTVVVG